MCSGAEPGSSKLEIFNSDLGNTLHNSRIYPPTVPWAQNIGIVFGSKSESSLAVNTLVGIVGD